MAHLPPLDAVALGAAGLVVAGTATAEVLNSARLRSLRLDRGQVKPGFADVLLYRQLVRPGIVKLANGAYLAMLRIRAADAGSYDARGLAQADVGLARVLTQLDSRTVVHLHEHHDRFPEYDVPEVYPHPVLHYLDERRAHDFVEKRPPFRSVRTLSIAWLPPSDRLEQLEAATTVGGTMRREDEVLDDFEQRLERFAAFARSYAEVERLGEVTELDPYGIERRYSQPLEHLMWCLYGRKRRVCVPESGMPLNGLLAEEFRGGENVRIGGQEVRVVLVKRVPDRSRALLFTRLHELQINYGFCVRFIALSGDEVRKELGGARGEWMAAAQSAMTMTDPHAEDMAESARQAIGAASSGIVRFGRTTISLVLRAPDAQTVDAATRRVIALLDEIGFPGFRARVSAEDGFYGYLPGDGYHTVRKFPLHALNLTHIFSFHEESAGRRHNESPTLPPRTPALSYLRSGSGDSLYRLHLNTEPRDTFDHLGVGKKGSGKSTQLAMFVAGWLGRYPYSGATVVDRGRSLYRLARYLDASILDLPVLSDERAAATRAGHGAWLGCGEGDEELAYPGFAVFDDVEQDRERALDFLVTCIELQGVPATARRVEMLQHALTRMIANVPPELRDLSALWELIPDPESLVRAAIRQYTRKGGVLGSTLDTPQDTMRFSRLTMIEIGRMHNIAPRFLVPVFKVAFWKARAAVEARKRATGNYDWHWLYEIDEAPTLLGNQQGEAFILDMLKQGRKEKHTVGLWGQVPDDFTKSGILADILSACGTRLYFRDTNVDEPRVRESYAALTLPSVAISRLGSLAPRTMLLHQPAEHEVQELRSDLDAVWLAIIGRSRDVDNRRLDEYVDRYPATWREELLRYEGVDDKSIHRFRELLDEYRVGRDTWDEAAPSDCDTVALTR